MVTPVGKLLWQSLRTMDLEEVHPYLEDRFFNGELYWFAQRNDFETYKQHLLSLGDYDAAEAYINEIKDYFLLFYEGDEEEGVTQNHLDQAKLVLQEAIARFKEEYRNQMSDRVWEEVKQELEVAGISPYEHCKSGYDKWNRRSTICVVAMVLIGFWVGDVFFDLVNHLKKEKAWLFLIGVILLPYLWMKREEYLKAREHWVKHLKDYPGWR